MSKLMIAQPDTVKEVEFNGKPEDRAEAEAAFKEAMKTGLYLAYVKTPGKKAEHIRSFKEVPLDETEVFVVPRLVGG